MAWDWEERVNLTAYEVNALRASKIVERIQHRRAVVFLPRTTSATPQTRTIGTWGLINWDALPFAPKDDDPINCGFWLAAKHHTLMRRGFGKTLAAGHFYLKGAMPPGAHSCRGVAHKIRVELEDAVAKRNRSAWM